MNNKTPVYNENGLQYTVTETGSYIVRYEGDAEKLVIPDTLGGQPVIGIGERAFANLKAKPNPYIRQTDYSRINNLELREIVLPETLQRIDEEAFGGLATLESLEIPESVTLISGYAFQGCRALKRIRLPKGISGVSPYTFFNCVELQEVIIPEGAYYIGTRAFENCRSLKEISVPDSVTEIGSDAFYESGLTGFSFPPGVREVAQTVLSGCKDLKELILPEEMRSAALGAFENCSSLKQIRIPASAENIGNPLVYGIPNSGRNSPNGCEKNVFNGCASLEAIDVDRDNELLSSRDGVLYSKDKTILILYPRGKKDEVFTVPDGVKILMGSAFAHNPYLKEAILPDSLEKIEYGVFSKCVNLRKAVPPSSLTYIGTGAYGYCPNLEEFPIPSSLTNLGERPFTGCPRFEHLVFPDSLNARYVDICNMENLKTVRIPKGIQYLGTFSGCPNLEKIDIAERHPRYVMEDGMLFEQQENGKPILHRLLPTDKREVFTIPDDIRRIKKGAFQGCRFREVVFPDTMTWIPDAFRNCRNLETIHFPTNLREIDNLAFEGCTGLKELVLTDGLQTVGNYTFAGCTGLLSAELPSSLRNYGVSLFAGCTSLKDVYLRGGARTWCRRNVIKNRRWNFPDQAVFHYK